MITFTIMSLVTSVKDYVEITHKLIELEPLKNYTEFGAVFTYFIFSIGDFLKNFFSFSLFKNIWSIPIIIPDIASAMISEVSVLDGYFHNAFTFLETNVNTSANPSLVIFEKFMIGLINSFFLFLPTSTSHLITLRRFVMQGLEAGSIAGLGTIAGNFLWLASIILGWRFFVIPWLSLDIFRYVLGFILLVKYIWDSSKERRMALEDLSKWKIFLLNFLLALTEQSCIYPFISNLSIGPDASILEGFPVDNYPQFLAVHGAYLIGILLGSFSLLQFTCWFWENPAFSIYLWITTKSSLKITTSAYYKILNFTFLYCTMLCAIASIPYYGLDYTITNPIGLVPQDRILDQKKSQSDPDKLITETAFLGGNPTDKNSRIRDGVHARRERWKQRLIKYQAYDASVYDQGVYDFLTIEDLNYGFDRFWLRRKMRNHQIRFRLFPGPWMRSLKKQLNNPANPSLESSNKAASGPRVEFFRILFEQFYHPNFHDGRAISLQSNHDAYKIKPNNNFIANNALRSQKLPNLSSPPDGAIAPALRVQSKTISASSLTGDVESPTKQLVTKFAHNSAPVRGSFVKTGLIYKNSALRKFVRNFNTRLNLKILNNKKYTITNKYNSEFIYSKRWKSIFSKIQPATKTTTRKSYLLFRNVSKQLLKTPEAQSLKLATISQKLSTKERKMLNLRTQYNTQNNAKFPSDSLDAPHLWQGHERSNLNNTSVWQKDGTINSEKLMLLRPLNVYLQKEQAFKRKLRYYGTTPMRKLTVGNQAPYFKALMKRGFYYYKPSLRLKKTFYVASMRRGFRKRSRKQRILVMPTSQNAQATRDTTNMLLSTQIDTTQSNTLTNTQGSLNLESKNNNGLSISKPTHSYTVLGKRATRYRHQIYKDVLQHWYYTPFNRLLLKFDVDAFINRQPKSHFLTKNEERLLHIRRFLLSEHYDTLRWYTYMQHYRTMQTNIGGTKSFASRSYNQQFQGTFKKIRHLFAITPKQGDLYTLKFDQPLYNDNKLFDFDRGSLPSEDRQMASSFDAKHLVYFHEELLTDNTKSQDSPTRPRVNSSDKKLNSANISGADITGDRQVDQSHPEDIINQSSFLIGKQFLNNLRSPDGGAQAPIRGINESKLRSGSLTGLPKSSDNLNFIYTELFVKLIKECKKRIHDQTFLKNYITHRIEKREQLSQEQTKELNKRLEKLKIWLTDKPALRAGSLTGDDNINGMANFSSATVLSTGMQKAVNDSIDFAKTNYSKALKSKPTYTELNNTYTIKTEEQILTKLNLINLLTISQTTKNSLFQTKLEKTKQLLINTINTFKPILLGQTQLLKARTDKNLQWWRQKQRVITKRKNARKRDRFQKQIAVVNKKLAALSKKVNDEKSNLYKTLYGNYEISDYMLTNTQNLPKITDSSVLRKKQDGFAIDAEHRQNKASDLYNQFKAEKIDVSVLSEGKTAGKLNNLTAFSQLRKKPSSKGRRYRSLSLARYLTATRKPRLGGLEGLTKIDNISNSTGSFLTKEEKQARLNLILKTDSTETPNLNTLKKSPSKQRSRHKWRKRARQQFSKNHYKYRKRHIHGNGKLRVMNKKLKKFKATHELRQWWWNSFLPRYLNNLAFVEQTAVKTGQPKDTAFKPLSNTNTNSRNLLDNLNSSLRPRDLAINPHLAVRGAGSPTDLVPNGMLSARSPSIELRDTQSQGVLAGNDNKGLSVNFTTTSLPFYAGWDESLRKFVVTNRLLSRRDAGLAVTETLKSPNNTNTQRVEFKNAPIQGLNEGSFLYWQTDMPFNSYNIDQFITTNQSFYAPLGWRRFEFRHSILKTWANQSRIKKSNSDPAWEPTPALSAGAGFSSKAIGDKTLIVSIKNMDAKPLWQSHHELSSKVNSAPHGSLRVAQVKKDGINTQKAVARRVKKRYKLLKQMPNQLMYTPTGPLLTEVLPSHYISVFDQQYRFPRNRYLKRNLLKTMKKTTLLAMVDSAKKNNNKEFTLRKRVKPRRKYHRKRFIKKDGLIFPRRTKFTIINKSMEDTVGDLRWRPSSRSKQKRKENVSAPSGAMAKPSSLLENGNNTLRSKTKSNKRVKTNPLRLRQLRRREFQQILKPIQRYIPRNGGFVWPGDYLRLEVVFMPKLKSTNPVIEPSQMVSEDKLGVKKTGLKQKINVQPVGIMPRKYLIEKHNILVLKKKLEKAYSSHQLSKAIKEYKLLIQKV